MPQIADDAKAIQKRRLEIFGERARWPEHTKEPPKPKEKEQYEEWKVFVPPWGFPFARLTFEELKQEILRELGNPRVMPDWLANAK